MTLINKICTIVAHRETDEDKIWINVFDITNSGIEIKKNIYQYIKKFDDTNRAYAYELFIGQNNKCLADAIELPRRRALFIDITKLNELLL